MLARWKKKPVVKVPWNSRKGTLIKGLFTIFFICLLCFVYAFLWFFGLGCGLLFILSFSLVLLMHIWISKWSFVVNSWLFFQICKYKSSEDKSACLQLRATVSFFFLVRISLVFLNLCLSWICMMYLLMHAPLHWSFFLIRI